MEKLELKHLAPYLPYGLNMVRISGLDGRIVNTTELNTVFLHEQRWDKIWKPILRPLSDLKNYISKLDFRAENEVQFTYYNSIPNQLTITATYKMMGDVFTDFIVNRNGFKNVDYWIVEKLFEWHFDVFGLIEKGLAVSIHDIKTK